MYILSLKAAYIHNDDSLVHLSCKYPICAKSNVSCVFQGRCVFASGSPFDAVTYNGQTFYPGQGNNAYIFPGVALGVICGGIRHIGEEIFLISAKVTILVNYSITGIFYRHLIFTIFKLPMIASK